MKNSQSFTIAARAWVVMLASILLITTSCSDDDDASVADNPDAAVMAQEVENISAKLNANISAQTDFPFFPESLTKAKVVGLGEATHGTHEFYVIKANVFKYLVTKHNHRSIIFEFPSGAAQFINRYVLNEQVDDVEQYLAKRWIYNTEEVVELIEWMRQYNQSKPFAQKIQFLGMDPADNGEAAELFLSYIDNFNVNEAAWGGPIEQMLTMLEGESSDYPSVPAATKSANATALQTLATLLEQNKSPWISQRGEFAYNEAAYAIRNLIQMENFNRIDLSKEVMKGIDVRDGYMGQNVQWLEQRVGKSSVWAHNGHVADWFADDVSIKMSGKVLKDLYGTQYYSVGFLFSTGKFSAIRDNKLGGQEINSAPPSNSTNHILTRTTSKNYFFQTRGLSSALWTNWKTSLKPILMVGSVYNTNEAYSSTMMLNAFDGVFYVDNTSASLLNQ